MRGIDKEKLLHYINVVSFAVDEATLFLDTHPCDKEALEYFENYNKARNQAMREYAMYFGPLTLETAIEEKRWNWAEQPWPWEYPCMKSFKTK